MITHRPLSGDEARELASNRRVQADRFVRAMVPYIHRTIHRLNIVDSLRDDAFQEGLVGAWVASQSWDPTKGPFAPWAAWQIRNHVTAALYQAIAQSSGMTTSQFRKAGKQGRPHVSLHAETPEGESLLDVLAGASECPEAAAIDADGQRRLESLLNRSKSYREDRNSARAIVHGKLSDEEGLPARLGISKQRIHQVWAKFLTEVRKGIRAPD